MRKLQREGSKKLQEVRETFVNVREGWEDANYTGNRVVFIQRAKLQERTIEGEGRGRREERRWKDGVGEGTTFKRDHNCG